MFESYVALSSIKTVGDLYLSLFSIKKLKIHLHDSNSLYDNLKRLYDLNHTEFENLVGLVAVSFSQNLSAGLIHTSWWSS